MVDDAGAPPQPPASDATGQDQSLDTNTEVMSTDPKVVSINRAKNKKSDDNLSWVEQFEIAQRDKKSVFQKKMKIYKDHIELLIKYIYQAMIFKFM